MCISPSRLRAAFIPIAFFLSSVTGITQAQTPPSQPPYPSTPQQRNVNPQHRVDGQDDDERQRRCTDLTGLEKSECERRDVTDDDAPAGVTSSMREKQEQAKRQREAPAAAPDSADPRSDEASSRIARSDERNPAKSESSDKTQAAEDEDEKPSAAASESESEAGADTLGSPRKPGD